MNDSGHGSCSPEPEAGTPAADGVPGPGFPRLEQSFDKGSLYALRAAVAAHAAAAGLPLVRVYDVVSAAHELAANAVRHGAGRGRLRLWVEGQYLRCEVSDAGPAEDAAASADHGAKWSTSHGHGLWLVGEVADQVSLDHGPGGTSATIAFVIRAPEPAPGDSDYMRGE